jgi:hypothetical protein
MGFLPCRLYINDLCTASCFTSSYGSWPAMRLLLNALCSGGWSADQAPRACRHCEIDHRPTWVNSAANVQARCQGSGDRRNCPQIILCSHSKKKKRIAISQCPRDLLFLFDVLTNTGAQCMQTERYGLTSASMSHILCGARASLNKGVSKLTFTPCV